MQSPRKNIFTWELFTVERHQEKWFERVVRPPWVRLILKNHENKILIIKEHRFEYDTFDYRIPGWKVFDELVPYLEVRNDEDKLNTTVYDTARLEAKEEAGIDELSDLEIVHVSKAWATVEWDLYYLSGQIQKIWEQKLTGHEHEHGIEISFLDEVEIFALIKSWKMKEDRSVAVLVRYFS